MVAPAIHRARVADSRPPRHGDVLVEAEADDDIWAATARGTVRVDESHAQGTRNVPVLVTHEDGAELEATLEAEHGGLDGVHVTIGDEQVIAPRVRGDDDGAGGNGLGHHIPRRREHLRFTAESPIRVVLGGMQVGTVEQNPRAAIRLENPLPNIVGLQAIKGEQRGRPHEARDGVPIWIVRTDPAVGNAAEREMGDITRDGAVIVVLRDDDVRGLFPPELTNLVHDATQDLVVHLRGIDRVIRSGAVRVIRCVWLLRPEDRQIRLFRRKDVVHECVGQVREPAPRESPGAIEWIRGLPIVEPLNRNRRCWVAVVTGEHQCSRAVRVDSVPRKRVPGVLELLRETQWDRRVLVEDDASAVVILDERGAEFTDGCCDQAFGLCHLKHRRHKR